MTVAYDRDNNRIKVGDPVDFKSDVEQCGTVKSISPCGRYLTLTRSNGFEGAYIGGQTTTRVFACDVWKTE